MFPNICKIAPKAYLLLAADVEGVFGGAKVQVVLIARELSREATAETTVVVGDYGQDKCVEMDGLRATRGFRRHTPKVIQLAQLLYTLFRVRCGALFQRTLTRVTGFRTKDSDSIAMHWENALSQSILGI